MQTPAMDKELNDRQFYMAVLSIEQCQCGRWKRRGMTFCHRCYKRLPTVMQRALYQPIGNGFEAAYDEAVGDWF
jgi:hypothetical protein